MIKELIFKNITPLLIFFLTKGLILLYSVLLPFEKPYAITQKLAYLKYMKDDLNSFPTISISI